MSVRKYIELEVLGLKRNYFWLRVLNIYIIGDGAQRAILIYRIGKHLYDKGFLRLARFMFNKLQREYGVYISPKAKIDVGFRMPHPTSIVIGAGVVIGSNVKLFQQTTLGGARLGDAKDEKYPVIGAGTVIFSGAKIIGDIELGKQCVVAANAVVNSSFSAGSVVAGVPATLKKVIL